MRYEQNHILPQKTGTRAYGIVKRVSKGVPFETLNFYLILPYEFSNFNSFFEKP